MARFFTQELERVRHADVRLEYDEYKLQSAYEYCEDVFTHEFEDYMRILGAVRIEE